MYLPFSVITREAHNESNTPVKQIHQCVSQKDILSAIVSKLHENKMDKNNNYHDKQ